MIKLWYGKETQISELKIIANSLQQAPIHQNREILATFFNFQNWGLLKGV